jgi:hypothetical protein
MAMGYDRASLAHQRTCLRRLLPRLRSLRDDRGASVVEFALTGTVLLLLVSLIVQGAILFNAWLVVTEVATEGARYGVPCYGRSFQSCSVTDIENVIEQDAPLPSSQLTMSVVPQNGILTVTVSYPVAIVAPGLSSILPSPMTVEGVSAMALEN